MNPSSFPEMYERWLVGPLFRPWAEITLDELKLSPGDRVLDIACGTGIVARVAKMRLGQNGRIVGVDINPEMLAVARSADPSIDWREGAATALPLQDGDAFEVVVCQQGLQFVADKPAAVAQMRKALVKGGRSAISTWRSDEEIPTLRELRRIAERHLGPIVDQRYAFGNADRLEELLCDAGFQNVRARKVSRVIRFEDGTSFLRMNAMAFVGMSAAGKTMDKGQRKRAAEAITTESASVLLATSDAPRLNFDLSTNLAVAHG